MPTITQLLALPNSPLADPACPNTFGVECEIESIYSHGEVDEAVWEVKPDGSLRNNGLEFVSKPIDKATAIAAFKALHEDLRFVNANQKFSPRTSIHVHANCKNLTEEQVKNVLLYYVLFEEVFFSLVQPDRRDNIHCVALNDTHLSSRYNMTIFNLHPIWSKYTAFNIKPLNTYGTIEFRHSDGHSDTARFAEWIGVIDNLMTLAKATPMSAAVLEKDNVDRWFDTLFGHCADYKDLKLRLPALIENSLIDIKLSFL